MDNTLCQKYAKALLHIGVNLQKGETVLLQTCTEGLQLATEVTKQAFEMGAKDVVVHIEDAEINHLRALHCDEETLKEVPAWKLESVDSVLRDGNAVQIGIMSSYPTLNNDVDTAKLLAQGFASNEVRNVVRKYIHAGTLKWVGTVCPSMNWAKQLYPELSDEEPTNN